MRMIVEVPGPVSSGFAKDFECLLRKVFPGYGDVTVQEASTDHQDVRDFHDKYGLARPSEPTLLDLNTYHFRQKFMQEELDEFTKAYGEGDLHGAADALVDLVYVAQGTADMMGLPWASLWNEVQRANLRKVRATSAEQSKRGSTLDVVKPAGWVGPNFVPWLGVGVHECLPTREEYVNKLPRGSQL